MKTTGNTILIAGGTSGIGLALARAFHQAGNTVVVAGRRTQLLDAIVTDNPGIHSLVLDVTDPASIATAYDTVTTEHPTLNVLVAMAGVMNPEPLSDPTWLSVSETTIATNLLGPIRLVHRFLPFLTGQQDPVVITVTSGLAFVPLPITPTYNATKAAMHSFTDSMRVQLADTPVQVIEMIPPLTATTLMGSESNPMAMPVDDLISESMTILQTQPDVEQVIVERVKWQRYAESTGTYDQVLAALSALR